MNPSSQMIQTDLFHLPTVQPKTDNTLSLQERFNAFHAANPHVYTALLKLARQLSGRGRKTYSIKGLFEVLRWHYHMTTTDVDYDFKLNNNYHSRYARLLMAENADLDGFFNLRELKA